MFIHWGVYSIPARGEWVMYNEKIPVKEYEKFPPQFNPVKFDADRWVQIAKNAGMKYIVITSKHHDGFCMWDSKVSSYDIMDATPFKRDVLKELSAACRKEGIKFCLYHSIMDWHHPEAKGASFPKYRDEYLRPQLRELLANYGPLGVLWFDGDWISEWTEEQGMALYNELRRIQPDIIINNRVGTGRNGMEGTNREKTFAGDFGTPEQEIPATGLEGYDWESCMTMNDNWGYAARDSAWKSPAVILHNLADIASKGGNYLLNVGPTSEGLIPDPSVNILAAIGRWMSVNGESIYGTQSSPFQSTPWGRCTRSLLPGGDVRVYLHVFSWPKDGRLQVPGLGSLPVSITLLADRSRTLQISRGADDLLEVAVPKENPDTIDAVIAMDFKGTPLIFQPPKIQAAIPIFLEKLDVSVLVPPGGLEVRYTLDGSTPTTGSPVYRGPFSLTESAPVKARSFYQGKAVSEVVQSSFQKVTVNPSVQPDGLVKGLSYEYFEGEWDSLPDFSSLTSVASGRSDALDLNVRRRDEKFGLRFTGYIRVPADAVYTFALSSDDGSRLAIGDRVLVDNDGLHGTFEKQGHIALARGLHPVTVTYFNKLGGKELALRLGPAGGEMKTLSAEDLRCRP
jgi:alpha-L-fucosidase